MKKRKIILQALLPLLTTGTMLFTACSEHESLSEPNDVPITFYLRPSSGQHITRAYEGDVAATTGESDINSVKVWFFYNGECISYSNVMETVDNATKVTMSVPHDMVGKAVDVYIVANEESAGLNLAANSTVEQLTSATSVLTGTNFTPGTPTEAVPSTGLPMSRIVKGTTIQAVSTVSAKIDDIAITRAVSKIRFAFGRRKGHTGEILGIKLNESLIASKEYIFPVDPATYTADYTDPYVGDRRANIVANSYESSALTFGIGAASEVTAQTQALFTIPEVYDASDPTLDASSYAWANWLENYTGSDKSGDYNTLMNTYTQKTVYLRESDKLLSGVIYYRLKPTSPVKEAPFTMVANTGDDPVQDFARNHIWIVYSYFQDGDLYVNPTIADWIDTDTLAYTLSMSTNMRLFDSWLYRYDTDNNYNNWNGSHMVVSEGRVTTATEAEPVTGRPTRSPQIQLITTGTDPFELIVDNDDFEIIRANKSETGVVTSYEASTNGVLTIQPGATPEAQVYTYFYIVPKAGVTPSNPVAKVSLFYDDSVVGKQKVTFNYSALPGYSDDSSEIWAYYKPAGEYNNNLLDPDDPNSRPYLKMYFQDYNNPLVPTPVQ